MIPKEVVLKIIDELFAQFEKEYKDAKERMAFIKEKRVWWQLTTIRMIRRKIDKLPVFEEA